MKRVVLLALLLGGCAAKQPVISAGAECVAFHRIDTTPDQDAAAKAAPGVWYSLFYSLATHNVEYRKRCG